MRGITRDTLGEMLDRKIFWVFGVITLLSLLIAAMSRGMDIRIQTNDPTYDLAMQNARALGLRLASAYAAFLSFLAVMASASALPTMLEKGRADFYLSKPVSRQSLLLSKLVAVWVVYGSVIVISSFLVYAVAGMSMGVFDARIFLLLAMVAIVFLVWLAITFAAGVVTGSTSMAIVVAFVVWAIQMVLIAREAIKMFFSSTVASTIIDGLYYVFPKPSEMSDIGVILALNDTVHSWLPLWSTLLFVIVLTGASLAYFQRKDF